MAGRAAPLETHSVVNPWHFCAMMPSVQVVFRLEPVGAGVAGLLCERTQHEGRLGVTGPLTWSRLRGVRQLLLAGFSASGGGCT
jgi:hypothetical protein